MGRVLDPCAGAEVLNLLKEDPPSGDAGALAENNVDVDARALAENEVHVDADNALISVFQESFTRPSSGAGAITEEHAHHWRDVYDGNVSG
jgi:hypothetical protein